MTVVICRVATPKDKQRYPRPLKIQGNNIYLNGLVQGTWQFYKSIFPECSLIFSCLEVFLLSSGK